MNIARHFQSNAISHPDQIALSGEFGDLTYRSLLQHAQALVQELPRQPTIGILAHRSVVSYAAVHAILSVGAAYVPLNPASHPKYTTRIQQLSGFTTLVVGEECLGHLEGFLSLHQGPLELVTLGEIATVRKLAEGKEGISVRVATLDPSLPITDPRPPIDGTCYILFTSGSTGDPKGVRVLHSNVDSYLDGFLEAFPIHREDRHSQFFDLTFDPSVHDLFATWKAGATLVVIPARLIMAPIEFAKKSGITVWYSGPSVPVVLENFRAATPGALPDVRLSLFAGEKFTWNAAQIWKKIAPNSRIVNAYGPTEATIVITAFEIPEGFIEADCHQSGIPIGKALPGQKTEIRRPDGSICDAGEHGALWLGGGQVAAGYLDPVATAKVFVARDGEVWYRTGDLAFADAEGTIFYIGRDDLQVKVLGFRIDLGELEAALLRITGASFAVAGVACLRGDLEELVCVLPTQCASQKKTAREALKKELEPYMIPKIWKFQDDLPLNSNGKIDRGALKAQWIALATEESTASA